MRALKIIEKGKAAVVETSIPKLRPEYVLVRTRAVALNPTDCKHLDMLPTPNATLGCDLAGVIEELDPAVPADLGLKKGERVAGLVHGGNALELEDGAFGDYVVVKAGLMIKIPDSMSFEEAATLGGKFHTTDQTIESDGGNALSSGRYYGGARMV